MDDDASKKETRQPAPANSGDTRRDPADESGLRTLGKRPTEADLLKTPNPDGSASIDQPTVRSKPVSLIDEVTSCRSKDLHDSEQEVTRADVEDDTAFVCDDDWTGRQVGLFTLRRRIGGGGGGVVYTATQEYPVQRTVAIKLLTNFNIDDLSRWETEPALLAELNHPNLVSIIDAGELPDKTRYLVMKLVEGLRVDDWVEQNRPSPTSIAKLIARVCRGIQYSHDYGVLHRDLKPSNILVDKHGHPVVTDFGLARTIQLNGLESITQSGMTIGTLGFLAPEQVYWSRDSAAPTVDVYGIGATLYQLLTGHRPTRIDNWGVCIEDLMHRDPPSIRGQNPEVPRDLESICLKCLEKSPASRYATVTLLLEDLNRFLHDLPIEARPIGRTQRLVRWARREPLVTSLALAMTGLFIAASVVFGVLWQNSEQARQRMQRNLDTARMIIQQEDNDADALLAEIPGSLQYRIHRLQNAIPFMTALVNDNPRDRQIQRRLAVSWYKLGSVLLKRGRHDESLVAFEEALTGFRNLLAGEPNSSILRFDIFHSLIGAGSAAGGVATDGEIPKFVEALSIIEWLVANEAENCDHADALACQLNAVARIRYKEKNSAACRQMAMQAIAIASDLVQRYPERPLFARHVLSGLELLCDCDRDEGQYDQARKYIDQAVEVARKTCASSQANLDDQSFLAGTLNRRALIAISQSRMNDANESHAEALQIMNHCIDQRPDHMVYVTCRETLALAFELALAGQRD